MKRKKIIKIGWIIITIIIAISFTILPFIHLFTGGFGGYGY